MNFEDFVNLLRARWRVIFIATIVSLLGAAAMSLLTTPLYQASTRLFVSTTSGATVADMYQGNLFSQQRVKSYTELLMGDTIAQRTVDKLNLDITAQTLRSRVKAAAKPDTVLINVKVLDESPVRARDIANALSDEFVVMVRQLETPNPGARPDARVVVEQPASIPSTAEVPKTARNIAVGLLVGLASGVGLAVLRDSLDNTVKDRQVLEDVCGVGVVGNIPLDKERQTKPAILFDSDTSAIAEAFRKLRTNLQFLAVDNPPRVIVVTSAVPNEGKSTTAINVALALAEADRNVVLVDGDMRRPSLDKYLNVVGSVGFSNVLSGTAKLDEVLQETKFPNLTVLAAGVTPPNPSELLGSLAARNTLSELRGRFDYVVVDSSPLLAVTDGAILAAGSDGTLLVVRYGKTKRDQLAHAVENLTDVGAVLLGTVSTLEPTGKGGGSYSYQYYGYGHKKSLEDAAESAPPAPDASSEDETSGLTDGRDGVERTRP